MRVHILSPYPERIAPIIEAAGDTIATAFVDSDFVVSYGYRRKLCDAELYYFEKPNRIINLHVSFLPYNRGADPNFWSWLDGTPKGITIHVMDKDYDTGPIIDQRSLSRFTKHDTLATTYWRLQMEMLTMFANKWPCIRVGDFTLIEQPKGGTYHRSADKEPIMAQLPLGWNTPVADVAALGKQMAA